IMDETDTTISWPSRLKIGAKSKKDPHIKVTGKPEKVAAAKTKIMSVLDTKSNRVTLKMDVSFTEHSHIIGKGGNIIRKVMEETGCHIHFPDSNRCTQQQEKSNQVSIAGQITGAEQARAKIRELLPLVLFFELPISGGLQPDMNSPTVQHVVQSCNVAVNMKQKGRGFSTTVTVRGSASNTGGVKDACVKLMDHLAGTVGGSLPVSMQLEIAPQHHQFMLARGGFNIKHIMQYTGATIHFPDPSTAQRKSSVFISGSIDAVIIARQLLMGCLPLVLMFDVKEDADVDSNTISKLMEQLDVFISVKPKPKQPSKSVIVKSVERNAASMYRARQTLLGQECENCGVHLKNGNTGGVQLSTVGMTSLVDMLGQNKVGLNGTNIIALNRLNGIQMGSSARHGNHPVTSTMTVHNRVMQHGISPLVIQSQAMNPIMLAQTGTNVQPPNHVIQNTVPTGVTINNQHITSSANILPPATCSSPTLVYTLPQNSPPASTMYHHHQHSVNPQVIRIPNTAHREPTPPPPYPQPCHHVSQSPYSLPSPQSSHHVMQSPYSLSSSSMMTAAPPQVMGQATIPNQPSAPISQSQTATSRPPVVPSTMMMARESSLCGVSSHNTLPVPTTRVSTQSSAQVLGTPHRTSSPVDAVPLIQDKMPTKSVMFTSTARNTSSHNSTIARTSGLSTQPPSHHMVQMSTPISPPTRQPSPPGALPKPPETEYQRKVPAPPPGFSRPTPEIVSSQLVQLHLSNGLRGGEEKPPPSSTLKSILRTSSKNESATKNSSSSNLSISSHLHNDLYHPLRRSDSSLSKQSKSPGSSGHFSPSNSGHFTLSNSGHFMNGNDGLYSPPKVRPMTPQETLAHLLGDRSSNGLSQGSSESEVDSDSSDKRAPGWERAEKQRELTKLEELVQMDYDQKKILAQKAMKKLPVSREIRTPTDTWSGLGFSKSMPDSQFRNITKKGFSSYLPATYEQAEPDTTTTPGRDSSEVNNDWPNSQHSGAISQNPSEAATMRPKMTDYRPRRHDSILSCSNYIDSTTLPKPTKGLWSQKELNSSLSVKPDLSELFVNLGLGKYTDVFQQQEIDLATFLTLTDSDLKELGIATFGARRKMLLAISGKYLNEVISTNLLSTCLL
ncbi:hypothetical protein BSL78_01216, partial [Apostichopus japonicus]